MKNFEFKSAICTSVEQSKRLLELGLKKETADMCYKVTTHDWKGKEIPEKERRYSLCAFYDEIDLVCGFQQTKTIPAWSLHRLIEMMPEYIVLSGQGHYISIREHCVKYVLDGSESNYMGVWSGYTLYDKLINCIEWLIKEGYFNKDYLEERK